MKKQCTGCVVSAGTHKPAEALHQIEDHSDGWIQDGPLLYRLTEGKKPQNRDEINVTMADGSRTEEARTRRAGELLEAIRAAAQQAAVLQDVERWPSVEVLAEAYEDAFWSKPAGNIYVNLSVLALALQERSNLASPAHPAEGVPEGFAMVPLKMTRAMDEVLQQEGWEWKDLLAAAESITEQQYAALAATQPAAHGE